MDDLSKITHLPPDEYSSFMRLTERIFHGDVEDSFDWIPPSTNVDFTEDLAQVTKQVRVNRSKEIPTIYVTGGFQGTYAQIQLMLGLQDTGGRLVIGLESDEYITQKGTKILLPLERRIALYKHIAPNDSTIFSVPNGVNYDDLANRLGVYRKRGVYHLFSESDDPGISLARINRCYSTYYALERTYGDLHTSDYE